MKKTLWRLGALAAGLLAGAPAAQAQQTTKMAPTAAELKKDIARLRNGTEGESEEFIKLMNTTPRRLVTYLKSHELTGVGAKAMGLDYTESKDADHLKVFTYSYSSGGTRGTIHRPVLQWQNAAGQRFAYAPFEECGFTDIHKLSSPGRTFYLLLGTERGSGQCNTSQAYVIELKGNYLLIDNSAFDKSASLVICNTGMEFDAHKQVLRIIEREYRPEPTAKDVVLKWQGRSFVETAR